MCFGIEFVAFLSDEGKERSGAYLPKSVVRYVYFTCHRFTVMFGFFCMDLNFSSLNN